MTATAEHEAEPQARRRKQEPHNPQKSRWMLWMPNELLKELSAETKRTGQPRAELVRQASEAVMALPPEERDAYSREAERRGVPVSEVYRTALANHGARLTGSKGKAN